MIKVAIYDADKGYRERFTDYLMSYKAEEMELSIFTGEQYFYETLSVDKYHLLVLGCGYEEILPHVKPLRVPILVLTEYSHSYVRETVEMGEEQVVYTPKYQSMDVITKQMQLLTELKWVPKEMHLGNREVEIVGVLSPVKHEMQMLFSLLYAKNMAKYGRVLYLNLLEFSGFSELFGETEYDMGDAILQMRKERERPEGILSCIYELDEVSYISPFANPENVGEITGAEICRLLEVLTEHTDYQTIVVDMGTNVKGFAEVLLACSKIYCLGKQGHFFEAQMRQFFAYIEKVVDAAFLERIETVEVPFQAKVICGGMNLLEQLNWNEFGDFVRRRM